MAKTTSTCRATRAAASTPAKNTTLIIQTKPGFESRKRPLILDTHWVIRGLHQKFISQEYLSHALFVLDRDMDNPRKILESGVPRPEFLDMLVKGCTPIEYLELVRQSIAVTDKAESEGRLVWVDFPRHIEGFGILLERLSLPPLRGWPGNSNQWDEVLELEKIPVQLFSKSTAW